MNIQGYCQKYGRDIDNNFAVACYNMNTLDELYEATEPDTADMNSWGISAQEWGYAIRAAIHEKLMDLDLMDQAYS
jgi:hypothetical protein